MRGIEVDKGLNTLKNGCVERGTILRRDMVGVRKNIVLFEKVIGKLKEFDGGFGL